MWVSVCMYGQGNIFRIKRLFNSPIRSFSNQITLLCSRGCLPKVRRSSHLIRHAYAMPLRRAFPLPYPRLTRKRHSLLFLPLSQLPSVPSSPVHGGDGLSVPRLPRFYCRQGWCCCLHQAHLPLPGPTPPSPPPCDAHASS